MSDPCDPLCPFLACASCPLNQPPKARTVTASRMEDE